MSYLVSVVVPTKNRYFYLKYLINLLDSFKLNELELVIQDNSDNNTEILEFLKQINNANIKYFYSNEKLSMSGNSDLAVLHSTGEYVCFIGDDDGVCRNIVDCVKWMKENDIDSLRTPWTAYRWGDYNKLRQRNGLSGTLLYKNPESSYKLVDPLKELKKSLRKGFQSLENMPLLYNGIVRREILEKVFSVGDTYFPGGSPDISNSVSMCFFTEKHAIAEIPVIIAGNSKMTGGGIYKRKGRISQLEDVGFISQSVIDNWEQNIPKIWAGRFAWPESGIKALRYVNHEELIDSLNFNYMFAGTAIYYNQLSKICFKYAPNKILFFYYLFYIYTTIGMRVSKNKILSLFSPNRAIGMLIKKNIIDIVEAEQFLFNVIKEKSFKNIINKI